MEGLLNVLSLVCTVTLGVVFASSGLAKLRAPQNFAATLAAQGYLPRAIRRAALVLLPPAEVVLSALLITGAGEGIANAASLALLVAFTGVMALGFQGKGTLNCGCFGSILGATSVQGFLARNGVFAVMAVLPLMVGRPESLMSLLTTGAVAAVLLSVLVGRQLLRRLLAGAFEPDKVENPARRAFLQSVAAIGGGAVLVGLAKVTGAEAACDYCGSCSQEIIWIGCNGSCCAGYWVRDQKYCDGYCYSCSSWRIQQWCSAWECC